MKTDSTGPENQHRRKELERFDKIDAEHPQEPEALLRCEELKTCEPIIGHTTETEKDADEMASRRAAIAEMVRLSQEIGLE